MSGELASRLRADISRRLRDGASTDAVVETALNRLNLLEARDPHFHRLPAVASVRARILAGEGSLGSRIDSRVAELVRQACVVGGNGAHGVLSAAASSTEIREAADGGDLDAQFSAAVAFILSSPEYQALQQNLIKEVQGAVDELKDRMMRLKSQRDENRNSMEVEMNEEYEPWDDLARVATRNSEYVRDDDGGGMSERFLMNLVLTA